jgi:hypothetical protein
MTLVGGAGACEWVEEVVIYPLLSQLLSPEIRVKGPARPQVGRLGSRVVAGNRSIMRLVAGLPARAIGYRGKLGRVSQLLPDKTQQQHPRVMTGSAFKLC